MLDTVCKAIIIGSILGDGSLRPLSKRGKSQLIVGYSDKVFPYLEWLHEKLLPMGLYSIRTKTGYLQHFFYSVYSRDCGIMRELFYPLGKKVIPKNISELLVNPISLAIWYMDDGNLDYRRKYHFSPTIATYCFSRNDCVLLQEVILKNFGINARVHKSTMRNKEYFRLYIESDSVSKFFNLISPYIHKCFLYKLGGSQQPR